MPRSSTTPKLTVISLVGRQGSGKSTLGSALATFLKTDHIEASQVVREIVGENVARKDMPKTNQRTKTHKRWLVDEIIKRFPNKGVVVVTGIREPHIQDILEKEHYLAAFQMTADPELRFQRQLELGKCTSAAEFLEHELNEISLGVLELELAAPFQVPTSSDTDPIRLAKAMVEVLHRKGFKLR